MRRYERGSVLITTNQLVSRWGATFRDDVLAAAILDRLLHHSQLVQPPKTKTDVAVRPVLSLIDTASPDAGYVYLSDQNDIALANADYCAAGMSGGHEAIQDCGWTPLPSSGVARIRFRSTSNPANAHMGVVLEAYEFRRSEKLARVAWTPLRLPGQYHDRETDLFENWNRFYDPSVGLYLSPDPILLSPGSVVSAAAGGMSTPVYAYASNNPVNFIDSNGLRPLNPDMVWSGISENPWLDLESAQFAWATLGVYEGATMLRSSAALWRSHHTSLFTSAFVAHYSTSSVATAVRKMLGDSALAPAVRALLSGNFAVRVVQSQGLASASVGGLSQVYSPGGVFVAEYSPNAGERPVPVVVNGQVVGEMDTTREATIAHELGHLIGFMSGAGSLTGPWAIAAESAVLRAAGMTPRFEHPVAGQMGWRGLLATTYNSCAYPYSMVTRPW